MIGFFQNTMAKHHKLMFAFLLVIIVVSFVFYTGSGSAMDLLGIRKSPKVCGVNLNDSEAQVYRAAVSLSTSSEASREQYIQALTQRIYLVSLAEKYEIPLPTQAELDEFTQRFFSRFGAQKGALNNEIIEGFKRRQHLDDEALKTLIIHDWKIEQLIKLLADSPSMFDDDIALRWQDLNTSWTIEAAELSVSAFKFNAEPTEEELTAYYAAHGEEYRIAPMMKLSYVALKPDAVALKSLPEPQESELKMFVDIALRSSGDTDSAAELKKNRPEWVKRWKQDRVATELASKISDMLAEKLPQDIVTPKSPDFEKALKSTGLDIKEIPAFPQNKLPTNSGVPVEILSSYAATLNETGWRTDAIPSGEYVYIVIFRGSDPSRIPALSEVREKVVVAWKNATREAKFFESAQAAGEKLRKEVAAGKSFADAAKSLGMSVAKEQKLSLQNLSASERAYGTGVIDAVKKVPLKSVSGMVRVGEKAIFACPIKKEVPVIDKNSEDYKRLSVYVNSMTSYQTLQMQISERINEILVDVMKGEEPAEQ